ncbi:MAG: type II toxin-antitoxin system PemK/MazF family toxin [Ginsengibacter sp.]
MVKGDLVLITFPFTNLSGSKLRPALVLVENFQDLTVCFITTQIDWQEETDILLNPTESNGLKKQSLIRTGKIATIDKSLLKGLLGRLSTENLNRLNDCLKILFKLN